MSRRLKTVRNKINKTNEKIALLQEELGLLLLEEEELEDQEIIAICRKNKITLEDLMKKIKEDKKENRNNENI
ncbi:conjugal transfer protein [Facklamia sp. P12955]|uniref:conjugal transfer protein n=1 Tax=Facklamia sp. P12955 TaxID=3421946 RepID=UPI003D1626C3